MHRHIKLSQKQVIKLFFMFSVVVYFHYCFRKMHITFYSDTNSPSLVSQPMISNDSLQYINMHRCTEKLTPLISSPLDTAQHLLFTNKSLIRFGDGEIYLMMNKSVGFQAASSILSQRLTEILKTNDPRLMIGLVDTFSNCFTFNSGAARWWSRRPELTSFIEANINISKQYFSAFISSIYTQSSHTFCHHLDLIYSTLKEIWRDKDIVLLRGNNSQVYAVDIYETAKSQTIYYAPRYNAWSDYQNLKTTILKEPPDKLFILAAGPVGKILAYDLMLLGRRALDLGHLAKDYNAYMTNSSARGFFRD